MEQANRRDIGRRTAVTNALGQVTWTAYDPEGRAIATWGATYPVAYEYDAHGRMSAMYTYRGTTEIASQSEIENLKSLMDRTAWSYDQPTGLLTNKVYADGKGTSYTYTPEGKLASRLWARGVTTTYAYTNGSSLAAIDYSDDTPDVAFAYDRLGRMTAAIVAGVSTNTYAYDGLDLVSETQNGVEIARTTDALGRDTGFSLGSDYSVQYGYDAYGRFHSVSSSVQSVQSVAAYSYLEDSDLISGMASSSGFLWARAYESRSLITAVENRYGEAVISRYDYENDELGRRTHIERSGMSFGDLPVRDAYEYNARCEVTSARRTPVGSQTELRGFSYDYDYDPIGNRITSTEYDHGGNAFESEYTANALNQYGQRTVPGYAGVRGEADTNATVTVNADAAWRWGGYFYGGDEADNSADAVMKELEITATYSNLFTSVTGRVFVAETPETFTYDDDGNLTQDGRFDYTWNGENRLIKAETRGDLPAAVPRVKVEYAYDHQGRMVWKQISTNAVVLSACALLWDGYNIVQETICNLQPSITNSYVWGLDLSGTLQGAGGVGGLLAEVKDGVPHYAAFDANGNVTEYLSADGIAAAHYEYSPFGEIVVQSGDLADTFTHRFSTKPWCPVTGLSEYELRKYSPSMGRWLSRDPVEELAGPALYWFVRNQTVSDVDIYGLCECGDCEVKIGSLRHPIRGWDAKVAVGYGSSLGISPKQLVEELLKILKDKAVDGFLKHIAPVIVEGAKNVLAGVAVELSGQKAFWQPQFRLARKTEYKVRYCKGTHLGIGEMWGSCCWKDWTSGNSVTASEWLGPEPQDDLSHYALLDPKVGAIDDKVRDAFIKDLVDLAIEAAGAAALHFDDGYFDERLADELSGKVGDHKSCKIVP